MRVVVGANFGAGCDLVLVDLVFVGSGLGYHIGLS